jgi:hypothetical protein
MRAYILVDGQPVRAATGEFAEWFETHDNERIVAKTEVGEAEVSTCFLGIDHNRRNILQEVEPPILWETMVFGGPHDGLTRRYSSLEGARSGHWEVVDQIKESPL